MAMALFSYNFGWGNRETIMLLWMVTLILPCTAAAGPSAMFVFGDSYSDTGNVEEAFPFRSLSEKLPFGSTYFGAPAARFSDGRLIVDFLAFALGLPFIDPYFKNIEAQYGHGVNFAVTGATACDIYDGDTCNITGVVPFPLRFQTDQFKKFKLNVNATTGRRASGCLDLKLPSADAFGRGLYFIFIGVNDMISGFVQLSAPMDSVKREILRAISKAIKELYAEEAREFVVLNIPPAGCFPELLNLTGSSIRKDSSNCLITHNQVIREYNAQLHKSLQYLQKHLRGATIRIVDIYQFTIDAITHPEDYGFDKTRTLSACFDKSTEKACSRPDKYISWDGLHFTDAFCNHLVKQMLFYNKYVLPPFNLTGDSVGKIE